MGVGPLARWKEARLPDLARRLRWAAGTAVVATIVAMFAHGGIGLVGALGLLMAFWIVASVATDVVERLRPVDGERVDVLARARLIPRAMVGMFVAHLGVAVFIVGVTLVRTGEVERDVKMEVGDTTTIGDYVFTFRGAHDVDGPNYRAAQGTIDVDEGGRAVATLRPEKRFYTGDAGRDDRGRDRSGPHAATSTSRSASRSSTSRRIDRPHGSCASTTSRSSTGSGAAAS